MSSNSTQRLYATFHWPQLAEIVIENWSDSSVLQGVLAELLYRRRSKAIELRNQVVVRLIELSAKSFMWPSTAILPSYSALSEDQFWYEKGLLSFMGYRVGQSGISAQSRRDILDYVYNNPIPRVDSVDYMRPWGQPLTAKRLSKMAECIAAFARNGKRNRAADMSHAVADWEADLTYLKSTYYVGYYDFGWPQAACRFQPRT